MNGINKKRGKIIYIKMLFNVLISDHFYLDHYQSSPVHEYVYKHDSDAYVVDSKSK